MASLGLMRDSMCLYSSGIPSIGNGLDRKVERRIPVGELV